MFLCFGVELLQGIVVCLRCFCKVCVDVSNLFRKIVLGDLVCVVFYFGFVFLFGGSC